jgi:purine-binding chemotaxis protein CheW
MPNSEAQDEIAGRARRFLTFRVAARTYAAPAETVAEVIRIPAAARVPHAPRALLGLANLRGSVLPLVSLAILLGIEEPSPSPSARAIVLAGDAPVAVVVDLVETLVVVDSDRVQVSAGEMSAEPGEPLLGAFSPPGGGAAKILDIAALLERAFAERDRSPRQTLARGALPIAERAKARHGDTLVTFDVADQEFALEIGVVQEIVAMPGDATSMPLAEAAVVGMIALREHLLPLLSLRALLGFPAALDEEMREKILVVVINGARIGLIADRARAVVLADSNAIDPTPPVFAARAGGETRIKAIYRADQGRRLISILAPEQLFREDVMKRLGAEKADTSSRDAVEAEVGESKFLIFRLGEDEFALPVEAVDEVARVPDRIARVPKAPKFLEGVINLRGDALPVVDQRRRFDMPARKRDEGARLIVVRTRRHRAGLIVDGVSRVFGASASAIQAAPDLTGDMTRMVRGVLNLEQEGRIILVLDPTELLTRAESGLLEAFADRARNDT